MGCGGSSSGSTEVKETAYEIELSKITAEEWKRYKTTYQPLFTDLAAKISNWGEGEKNVVKGKINSALTGQYDATKKQAGKSIAARGLDPSSSINVMSDINRDESASKTSSFIKGDTNVDTKKNAGLQNIVGMARGDAGQAMSGLSSLATNSVQDAIADAQAKQQSYNDTMDAFASAAGMGLSAYNKWKTPTSS